MDNLDQQQSKTYPTPAGADGFYFEDATDEAMGISTNQYENGNKVKRYTLASGKVAIVRELKGKDQREISRFASDDKERYLTAGITVATQVDGNRQPFEFYEDIKMKDYNALMGMYTSLNF